jgi:hypothetical protein
MFAISCCLMSAICMSLATVSNRCAGQVGLLAEEPPAHGLKLFAKSRPMLHQTSSRSGADESEPKHEHAVLLFAAAHLSVLSIKNCYWNKAQQAMAQGFTAFHGHFVINKIVPSRITAESHKLPSTIAPVADPG